MPLRKRMITQFFCPRCGYVAESGIEGEQCPACGDGEHRAWSGSSPNLKETFVNRNYDALDEERDASMEGGE